MASIEVFGLILQDNETQFHDCIHTTQALHECDHEMTYRYVLNTVIVNYDPWVLTQSNICLCLGCIYMQVISVVVAVFERCNSQSSFYQFLFNQAAKLEDVSNFLFLTY